MNILEEIASKRILDINKKKKEQPYELIKEKAENIALIEYKENGKYVFPFKQALLQLEINFICEVKKASPSKGIIAEDFPYLDIAKDYEKAGAAAVSVLTEPNYFLGSDIYLKEIAESISIPVIRKDFIVDEYMIYEAKLLGASAVLLICSLLDDETLKKYLDIAHSLGLSALVEAHDEEEVKRAIKSGARIIGVNNRDLKNFKVDINNSVRLRKLVPKDIIFVSESGIKTAEDIEVLRENGTNAVLIGETLMKCKDKKKMLKTLAGVSVQKDKIRTKIKICGLRRKEDIEYVNEYKPDYVGFVFAKSKRQINKGQAKELKKLLNPDIKVVGVFVNEDIQNIVDMVNDNIIDLIQLHGDESNEYISNLRKFIEETNTLKNEGINKDEYNVEIIKAVRVKDKKSIDESININADYLLFDTYSAKEYGGTGHTFDWQILKDIDKPYFLAGGLNSQNIKKALEQCKPYAVDVSSAIETDGYKDREKIKEFIKKVEC